MVNDEDRIVEKIRRYLEEKEGLTAESCYFITKRLNEDYWEEISIGEEEEAEGGEDLDLEEVPEEEVEAEAESPVVRKPKVRIKRGGKSVQGEKGAASPEG